MKRTLTGTVLAAVVLLAGCGSNAPEPVGGGTTPPGAATSSPGTGTSTPGAATPLPGATTPGGAIGGSVAPQPTGTIPTAAPLDATLDKTCVQRGVASDPQGLAVHVKPGAGVSYMTFYSDGSSAQTEPPPGGGGGGLADATGTFRRTWVVPATAPLGTARVVVASENAGAQLPFTVIDVGQPCP